jgi:hypothetical protein
MSLVAYKNNKELLNTTNKNYLKPTTASINRIHDKIKIKKNILNWFYLRIDTKHTLQNNIEKNKTIDDEKIILRRNVFKHYDKNTINKNAFNHYKK